MYLWLTSSDLCLTSSDLRLNSSALWLNCSDLWLNCSELWLNCSDLWLNSSDLWLNSNLNMGFELRVQQAHTPKSRTPASFFASNLRDLGRRWGALASSLEVASDLWVASNLGLSDLCLAREGLLTKCSNLEPKKIVFYCTELK